MARVAHAGASAVSAPRFSPAERSRRFVPAAFVVGALTTAEHGAVFEDGPLFLVSEGSFFSTGRKVGRNYTTPAAYAGARHAEFDGLPLRRTVPLGKVHFQLVLFVPPFRAVWAFDFLPFRYLAPPDLRVRVGSVVFGEQLGSHALGCDRLVARLRNCREHGGDHSAYDDNCLHDAACIDRQASVLETLV